MPAKAALHADEMLYVVRWSGWLSGWLSFDTHDWAETRPAPVAKIARAKIGDIIVG
jgi:hypothetical protein